MVDRHSDLMKQGFMKPAKKRTGPQKTKQELCAEIVESTGVHVQHYNGKYAILHPAGHWTYTGKHSEAKKICKMISEIV